MKNKVKKNLAAVKLFVLLGFVFLAGIPSYIYAVCDLGYEDSTGICLPQSGVIGISDDSVGVLLAKVVSWLLYFIGFLSIIFIVISGLQYIVSAGDEKKAEIAKNNLKSALIGLTVALLALIIVRTILQIVN